MRWLLITFLLTLLPSNVLLASVSISEVAWMGSSASANHEWIELFNSGDSVLVEGWTLTDGMNLTITLTGTIPANGYVVLERNRSDGGSVVGTPFLNYAGALVNTGATLILRRDDGTIVDQVAGGENWQNIGGDNTTKDTAQYTSSGWITGVPTPGRANTTVASVIPTTTTGGTQTTGGGTRATTQSLTVAKLPPTPLVPEPLSLQLSAPVLLYEGQPVSFTAMPSGSGQTIRNSLTYEWNFGDLHTSTTKNPTHTYEYPGTYNVVVQARFAELTVTARQAVTVLPLTVSLAHTQKGDVLLHNDALYEVDISEYYLTASKTKKVPPRTYLSPRETLTIPWQMVSETPFPTTALFGRDKEKIAQTGGVAGAMALAVRPAEAEVVSSSYSLSSAEGEVVRAVPVAAPPASPQSSFGFLPAVAQAASPATLSLPDDETEVGVASVLGDTDSESSVTPLVSAHSEQSKVPLPPLSSVWVYVAFVLVLGGAVASIVLRPASKERFVVAQKND